VQDPAPPLEREEEIYFSPFKEEIERGWGIQPILRQLIFSEG
jgi:hypothetical protein